MRRLLKRIGVKVLIYPGINSGNFALTFRGIAYQPKHKFFDPYYEESVYGSNPITKSGGVTLVTLAPGLGGTTVWEPVIEILKCAGAPIEFEYIYNSRNSDEELENLLLSIQRNGIAVKGNIQSRFKPNVEYAKLEMSRNMIVRRSLDLFVRVHWIKSLPPLKKLMKVHKNLDIVLIRQNTEGEFSLLEYRPLPKICEHLAIVTRYNSRRIAEYAFNYAKLKERKKVSLIVNKAVIPKSSEIFAQAFLDVAENYPEIKHEVMDVTKFTLKLQYEVDSLDVILATSLLGSILFSSMQGYLGSAELIPSLNVGNKYKVWESAFVSSVSEHSSFDNPISYICIFISILKDLGATKVADAITESLMETLHEGVSLPSLGGTATIYEFTRFMVSCLKTKIPGVQCSYDERPRLPPKPPPTKPFQPEFMPGMVPPNPNYKEFPPLTTPHLEDEPSL